MLYQIVDFEYDQWIFERTVLFNKIICIPCY